MAITIVGSVALDTLETPFGRADNALGGAASYFSLSAALFTKVNLVAVVGTDFPQRYVEYFRARDIDLAGLQVVEGETFRWGGRYYMDFNTRDTLFTELGVFAGFSPQLPVHYRDAGVVFLANIQPQLQLDVLRQAREASAHRLTALDTMNLWIETERDALMDVLRQVDVVLIAEEEVRQLSEMPGLRAGARYILGLGPRMLVVKQGSYGALLFGADGSFFAAPAYPLEDVRDPTGAGDAFAGGFLGHLASRMEQNGALTSTDYKRALIHGNILGSYACEEFSVNRLRQLTRDDIAGRYGEFVDFTHVEAPNGVGK